MWALLGGYIGAIILLQFCIGLVQKSPHIDGNNLSLATKKDLHLRRKIQHATTGLMILNATCFLSVEIAAGILFVFSGFFYFVYLLRCYSKRFDTIYLNHFQSIMREKEIKKQIVPSSFDFLIGNAIVLALFPKKIAQLAILHVRFVDIQLYPNKQ
jgi:dolichol kinase